MNRLGSMMRCAAGLLSVMSLGFVLVPPSSAAAPQKVFRVCTSGCPFSSLAAALAEAPDGAKILVGPGTYASSAQIAKSVTVQGAGAAQTTLRAGPVIDFVHGTGPVIRVDQGVTVTIRGVTVTGGLVEHYGGGIFNSGVLTVVDSAIRANRGGTFFDGHGGGIYNEDHWDVDPQGHDGCRQLCRRLRRQWRGDREPWHRDARRKRRYRQRVWMDRGRDREQRHHAVEGQHRERESHGGIFPGRSRTTGR